MVRRHVGEKVDPPPANQCLEFVMCHYSLVVERQPCKLKVLGSIPSGGYSFISMGDARLYIFQPVISRPPLFSAAAIAQLGERQTEDLEVPGSIPGLGMNFFQTLQPQDLQKRKNGTCED